MSVTFAAAPLHARGLRVESVIIAPEFAPKLLDTAAARRFGALEKAIWRKPAWIRHDEHVHLDFAPLTTSDAKAPPPSAPRRDARGEGRDRAGD